MREFFGRSERGPIGLDLYGREIKAVQLVRDGKGWRVESAVSLPRAEAALDAAQAARIADVFARAGLDDDYRDGLLSVRATLAGGDGELTARLLDPRGNVVFEEPFGPGDLERHVRAPRQWSAEEPALHTLVVRLEGGESVACRLGFRRVDIRDEGLLKLFFADLLPGEAALALLRVRRATHERILDQLRQIESGPPFVGGRAYPDVVLSYGIGFHSWAVGWCEEMERRLTAEAT